MTEFVLAVDPGKNIGRAIFDYDGKLHHNDVVDLDTFLSDLAISDFEHIVYEDWHLFARQMQQTGSKMEASQVIGALKMFAQITGAELHPQPSSILPVSALHAGKTLPRGHTPDDLSAFLHGHYHLIEAGVLQPVGVG